VAGGGLICQLNAKPKYERRRAAEPARACIGLPLCWPGWAR